MPTRIEGGCHVSGGLSCDTIRLPAGAVTDNAVATGADIAASKLQHQHRLNHAQPNTVAVAETRVVYVCYGSTGTILDFRAGSIAAATGDATMTVDLHKNGVSVLVAPITLDSTNANRVAETGTLNVTTLAANDVLEVVVTVNAGTGALGTGLFASVTVEEDPI